MEGMDEWNVIPITLSTKEEVTVRPSRSANMPVCVYLVEDARKPLFCSHRSFKLPHTRLISQPSTRGCPACDLLDRLARARHARTHAP